MYRKGYIGIKMRKKLQIYLLIYLAIQQIFTGTWDAYKPGYIRDCTIGCLQGGELRVGKRFFNVNECLSFEF